MVSNLYAFTLHRNTFMIWYQICVNSFSYARMPVRWCIWRKDSEHYQKWINHLDWLIWEDAIHLLPFCSLYMLRHGNLTFVCGLHSSLCNYCFNWNLLLSILQSFHAPSWQSHSCVWSSFKSLRLLFWLNLNVFEIKASRTWGDMQMQCVQFLNHSEVKFVCLWIPCFRTWIRHWKYGYLIGPYLTFNRHRTANPYAIPMRLHRGAPNSMPWLACVSNNLCMQQPFYVHGSNSGSCSCVRMLRCNSDGHIALGTVLAMDLRAGVRLPR